jgi:hypothetical protein
VNARRIVIAALPLAFAALAAAATPPAAPPPVAALGLPLPSILPSIITSPIHSLLSPVASPIDSLLSPINSLLVPTPTPTTSAIPSSATSAPARSTMPSPHPSASASTATEIRPTGSPTPRDTALAGGPVQAAGSPASGAGSSAVAGIASGRAQPVASVMAARPTHAPLPGVAGALGGLAASVPPLALGGSFLFVFIAVILQATGVLAWLPIVRRTLGSVGLIGRHRKAALERPE